MLYLVVSVTLWRSLSADALQPWRHRSWIFPRDPQFAEKAGRILDLYGKTWDGTPLLPDEFVISADEKPSLQARRRKHPTLPPGPASSGTDRICNAGRERKRMDRTCNPTTTWGTSITTT